MKILITGGAGFIGSALSKAVIRAGHEVTTFDKAGSADINGDITSSRDVENAAEGCDTVFHLAAFLGVKNTESDPLRTLEVNIQGTRNILEACIKNNVKKLVFSSSSEVYGNPRKVPIEEGDPLSPVSAYGFSKAVSEEYIKAYNRRFGLEYSIVRYFNVYGPGQRLDFVLPKLVSLAVRNEPLEIYGDGNQVRAFTNVSDAISGTLLAMDAKNEIFNIGNDTEPVTMNDLANRIIKITGSASKIRHLDFAESDRAESREIFKRIPSIIKARERLGYQPKRTLEEGIAEVANWVKKQ